jgi:hypothetical protein
MSSKPNTTTVFLIAFIIGFAIGLVVLKSIDLI